MVEDRLTDPVRIAQLLSSELAGRDDGPLGDVTVVDADRDAEPTPAGTAAFGVAVRDERVGDVVLYPDVVAIEFAPRDPEAVATALRGPGVAVDRGDGFDGGDEVEREDEAEREDDGRGRPGEIEARSDEGRVEGSDDGSDYLKRSGTVVRIEYGAAVKRAVDAFVAGFEH